MPLVAKAIPRLPGVRQCLLLLSAACVLSLGCLPWLACGADSVLRSSLSGQFVIAGVPFDETAARAHGRSVDYVLIEPTTAVVSCERIKAALLRELQIPDQWEGKIYLRLRARRGEDETVRVSGQQSSAGWTYSVDLPDLMGRRRFFNTIVQVLLFEIGNRGTRNLGIPAEMPKWLEEGLPAHLEAQGGLSLIAEPFSGGTSDQKFGESVEALRTRLRQRPPLTLDELNWPRVGSGVPPEQFRDSAHLMVRELLRMDQGAAQMVAMLRGLKATLNWQTSFLAAYHPRFERMVDLEKWWTLTTSLFLGRERGGSLPALEALEQLGQILSVPLDVRLDGVSLPARGQTSLRKVISDGGDLELSSILQRRLPRLRGLQLRCPPAVAKLVAAYHDSLSSFMTARLATGGTSPEKIRLLPNARLALKKVVGQLEELDRDRARMEAEQAALVQSRVQTRQGARP